MKTIATILSLAYMGVCGAVTPEDAEAFLSMARQTYSTPAWTGYTNTLISGYGISATDFADRPVPGGRIRWYHVDGMRNVRDLGGWNGLPTGRVFRGSEPDCHPVEKTGERKFHNLNVTSAGLKVLREELGIRTDLDLRGRGECPHPERSSLGVPLVRVPLGAYMGAFSGTNQYAQALRVFADAENYPVYLHCWGGADRTGTIAYLLEGLCGATETDLAIDYELTSFAGVFGKRLRTGTKSFAFPQFVAMLKTYPGDSLSDKIACYMEQTLGLTKQEISAIRQNVLKGTTDRLVFRPGATEVVLAPEAPGTTVFAAAEATNFLTQVLGAEVPIVAQPTEGRSSLVLGTNTWSLSAGVQVDGYARDEFCIRTRGRHVYIAGHDDNVDVFRKIRRGEHNARFRSGTLFGVYEFLERFAGIRFYFPGELGTVVPRRGEIVVEGNVLVKPAFAVRDCYVSAAGLWPDAISEKEANGLRLLYKLRLRECAERPRCCHGQNRFNIAERFSETHPEYFMLRKDGTRCTGTKFAHNWEGRQLCHTSPVWDVIREETLERIRKGETNVDVMPQDGMQPCWCPTCQARFNTTNFSLASGYATELIWSNTVAVAQAITAAGLKGSVAQMAYGTYRDLPSMDIPGNVNLVLAVGGPWSESHPDIRDRQVDFVRGWSEKLGRRVSWIWTYPMKNYGRLQAPDVPQHAPHAYISFYSRVAPYIDGSFVESNCAHGETLHLIHNYLNFYAFSKFAWDHSFDLDAALAEHHRLMFGTAADEMATFFDILEKTWIGHVAIPSVIGETEIGPKTISGPSQLDLWTKIYTPVLLDELRGYLDRAAAKVPAESLSARRIAWVRRGFYDALATRAADYMKDLSVECELRRRAGAETPNVMEGLAFSLPGGCSVDRSVCVTREGAVKVVSTNRVYAGCSLKGRLKANTKYRLSYFIKLENLASGKGGQSGACVEYEEYAPKYRAERCPRGTYWLGTRDWLHQSLEFTTGADADQPRGRPSLWFRVFDAKGTVWFDGVRLEEVK